MLPCGDAVRLKRARWSGFCPVGETRRGMTLDCRLGLRRDCSGKREEETEAAFQGLRKFRGTDHPICGAAAPAIFCFVPPPVAFPWPTPGAPRFRGLFVYLDFVSELAGSKYQTNMDRWFGKKKKVEVPSPLGGASLAGTTDASSPYADPAIAEADAAINQALGSSSAIPMTSVGVDTPAVPAAAVTVTAPSSSGMPSPPGSPTPSSLPLDSVYGPSTTLAGGSSTASMVGGPTSPSGSAPGTPGEPAGPGLPPMESLSPYTQQLIKDHKKAAVTGAAAGAAGKDTAIPIDYASNPLDKLKEMRPGTKRKVLFGSLSFIFLLAGIIGVVVSWYYAWVLVI